MTNTRITKKDRFNQLLNIAEVKADPELVAFIEHEKELLARKNASTSNGPRKPTKTQIANAEIGEAVASAMVAGQVYTIADVSALVPALEGATPQKVGPIMRRLRDAGRLTEDKVKGKVVYALAVEG
jgi:hypothetical protein